MKVIGITGSLGTGKTTVAAMFGRLGAAGLDADKIAHGLLAKGQPCYQKVVKRFGLSILSKSGEIDRRKLAEKVFGQTRHLKALEGIIHPEVIKTIKREIKKYRQSQNMLAVVLDVPLLFESGMDRLTDASIVVVATQKEQIERSQRPMRLTRRAILKRIKVQMPLKEKLAKADYVIDNRGTLSHTRKQVRKFWADYIKMNKKV